LLPLLRRENTSASSAGWSRGSTRRCGCAAGARSNRLRGGRSRAIASTT